MLLKIKKSQKQPSYFAGMEIGDEVPIVNRDNIAVKFEKTSNESGMIHIDVKGHAQRAFEIDYDFDKFPTLREQFIKQIRYLVLRDFSIQDFQNDDLKDTKLNLIKHLDLGYGLRIVKIAYKDVPNYIKQVSKQQGRDEEVPSDPSQLLPKETLKDFIYAIYRGDTILGVFAIPFNVADEVYDLNSLDDVRDFFIELVEGQMKTPIEEIAKSNGIDAKPFARLDNGLLNSRDILDFYNEQAAKLDPGSKEMKVLQNNVNGLIHRLHSGDNITKEDLKMSFTRPSVINKDKHIKDYRRMILESKLNRDIARVEQMFETRLKSEHDVPKISELRKYYFDMKKKVSDLKMAMDDAKDVQPIISDINSILEKAADFIKK